MDDQVRHLAMLIDCNAQGGQRTLLEDSPLRIGIAYVENLATGSEVPAEILDHLLDENVLSAGTERERPAVRQGNGDTIEFSRGCVPRLKTGHVGQVRSDECVKTGLVKTPDDFQSARMNLV